MNKIVYDLLLKLEECDDKHNRCDYLMEHDEITYLLEYINQLKKENKELKDLPFIKYQKAILKITEVLDTKSIFIRKKKIKKILEEYYYESN